MADPNPQDKIQTRKAQTQKQVERVAKQLQAVEMRLAGYSFDQIAQSLGYAHRKGAERLFKAALQAGLREPAAEARQQEILRLERLLRAVWPHALSGSLEHVEQAAKLSGRICTLKGLDLPQKVALTNPEGDKPYAALSDTERALALGRLYAAVGQEAGGAPAGQPAGADGPLPGRPGADPPGSGDAAGPLAGGPAADDLEPGAFTV